MDTVKIEQYVNTKSQFSTVPFPDKIMGRVVSIRSSGKIIFVDILCVAEKIHKDSVHYQASIDANNPKFNWFKVNVSRGDILTMTGEDGSSKTGHPTFFIDDVCLMNKAVSTVPNESIENMDDEFVLRQRMAASIMSRDVRNTFRTRSKILSGLRDELKHNGFYEAETPVLQNVKCGALASPFKTHHNALNADFYLRVAPETHLKRYLAASYLPAVYEIAKCFRNEGISTNHLQEFTMLEFYKVGCNMQEIIVLTLNLLDTIVQSLELNKTFDTTYLDFNDLMKQKGVDPTDPNLRRVLGELGFISNDEVETWEALDDFFKHNVRPNLPKDTFCIVSGYPAEMTPLAVSNRNKSSMVQIIFNGQELAKMYQELVDPIELEDNLKEQARCVSDESMQLDHQFIEDVSYGMPPMIGCGIGIDRVISVMSNLPIKHVIPFPLMNKA